jgi:diguanylate cyclase (GGDEF)-like protein/PAS domain S-box-containing protein
MLKKIKFSFGKMARAMQNIPLLGVFLIVSIPTLAIPSIATNLFLTRERQEQLMTEQTLIENSVMETLAFSLELPLANLQQDYTQRLVDVLVKNPNFSWVRIYDLRQETVFAYASRLAKSVPDRPFEVVSIDYKSYPIVHNQKTIGRIDVVFDKHHLEVSEKTYRLRFWLLGWMQFCFSLGLLWYFVNRRYLQPMKTLEKQAKELINLNKGTAIQHWTRRDEIGNVGRRLEWARAKMQALFEEIRHKKIEIEEELRHQKIMEVALIASEGKYRELFLSNLDGIVIADLQGKVLDANPAFLKLLQLSLSELCAQPLSALMDLHAAKQDEAQLTQKVLLDGFCDEFETTYQSALGDLVSVSVKIIAMKDDAGHITALWRIVRDTTEQNLRAERMRLADAIIDASVDAMAVIDRTGRMVRVNPALVTLSGYSEPELLMENSSLFATEFSLSPENGFLDESHESVIFWQSAQDFKNKTGQIIPVFKTVSAVYNARKELTHFTLTYKDISEQLAAAQTIEKISFFDEVTQLPNRLKLEQVAQETLARATQGKQLVAILMINIDDFKTINESLGRAAGDVLLQKVAYRSKTILEGMGLLARHSGAEFIFLTEPMEHLGQLTTVLDDVKQIFATPFYVSDQLITVTACIGIGLYPSDALTLEHLMNNASTSLALAKAEGRNHHKFYTNALNTKARETLALDGQLRLAIEREEFELYYQPIVEIASKKVTCVEALIRWNHPQLGLLAPYKFLEIAEQRGLMVKIGSWVLRQACQQNAAWRAAGLVDMTICVNLSPVQFQKLDLIEELRGLLAEYQLEGSALELEITEGMMMKDMRDAVRMVNEIKALGIAIAIDDFGTGYSSLSYLKRFKANKLKIDRSFVQDTPEDLDDCALIKAMVQMAQSLNMHVVAEGLENQAQWDFIASVGCAYAQGYWVSEPLNAVSFFEKQQKNDFFELKS